jgi:carboxyvinyl-carboxyphosphonate phosphorylmutase
MNATAKRAQLRAFVAGSECISPASVYDAMSASIAESAGFKVGLFSGKIASASTLAAPDLNVITLTELAEQARRITRASDLSLVVDADHGYGNALNAMRTVEELEHAGVAMMSLEDTALPARYGQPLGQAELVTLEEMTDKVSAAVKARVDPALMIAARTGALNGEGRERAVARAKAYAAAGADAIFLMHVTALEDVSAVYDATGLPIVLALVPPSLARKDLAARGARVLSTGHHPVLAAAKALQDAYQHLYRGGAPEELESRTMSEQDMNRIVRGERYTQLQRDYLKARGSK